MYRGGRISGKEIWSNSEHVPKAFMLKECSLNSLYLKGRHITSALQLIDKSPAVALGQKAPRCYRSLAMGSVLVSACLTLPFPDPYTGCISPVLLYSGFLLDLIYEGHLQMKEKREEIRVFMALLSQGWVWGVDCIPSPKTINPLGNSLGSVHRTPCP